MYPTKNDLPETTRRKMIELCNARLADAIDLQTQTKQAHWNVKGPHFIALHELFDKVNEDIEDYVDLIAERAVQLGGAVEGTARSVARRSTLADYPLKTGTGRQHVDALSSALAAFGKVIRSAIEESDRAGDDDTNDIFIEISRGVDKWLWMVEAHLSPDESPTSTGPKCRPRRRARTIAEDDRLDVAQRGDAALVPLGMLAEHAFSRAAGAPLVPGNRVELLRDATENYPAWLDAIERAHRSITLESYILADDAVGNRFADAMSAAARRGVRVRVLQDWLGARGEASHQFWARLRQAGVEVRWFNPFRFEAPLAWLRRNHRKSLLVDGRLGFVTGLCIAARWAGDPARGIPPWRDTGIQIEGPAVADLAHAFARTWAEAGPPETEPLPRREEIAAAGGVSLRVIATEPATTGIFRLDTLVAALSR